MSCQTVQILACSGHDSTGRFYADLPPLKNWENFVSNSISCQTVRILACLQKNRGRFYWSIHATLVAKYYKAMLVFGVIIADGIFYHGVCFIENFPTNLIMQ